LFDLGGFAARGLGLNASAGDKMSEMTKRKILQDLLQEQIVH
jgi:hypothetical protein